MKAVGKDRNTNNYSGTYTNLGLKVDKMTLDYRDEFGTNELQDKHKSKDILSFNSQRQNVSSL